ncbi:sulfate ABC transporter permease [Pararhodonellum marinum]|uniref:sulfate ABC transporter permease n=1 Tax=Pararhodonellum marinum TaxID=2755358 RepID=UPI00188F4EA7|nr:sulfate ABC transporter permease [Pararhodonellum marinum]
MSPYPTKLSQRAEELINFDGKLFFVLLVLFFVVLRYLTNELVLEAIPGREELEKTGTFTIFHILNTLNYLWTPFSLLWNITMITFLIWVGSFMYGYKIPFRPMWKFVMLAYLIFIVPEIIRLLWFLVIKTPDNFREVENFYPLSLFSLVNPSQVAAKFHYPLKTLNLFEVMYWYFLAVGFHTISRRNISTSIWVILGSYVLILLVWLVYYILVYK